MSKATSSTEPRDGAAAPSSAAALEPADSITITDVDTLKSLSDPLRIRILELLSDPRPVKPVAAALGIPKTRLYYHLGVLEKHGLIRVVSERLVSGIVERTYQVTAKQIRIDKSMLAPGDADRGDVVGSLLQAVQSDVERSMAAGLVSMEESDAQSRGLYLSRMTTCIRPEDAPRFYKQLAELFEAFTAATDDASGKAYSLTALFHPSALGEDAPPAGAPKRRRPSRRE